VSVRGEPTNAQLGDGVVRIVADNDVYRRKRELFCDLSKRARNDVLNRVGERAESTGASKEMYAGYRGSHLSRS
jgi:hypothetical protein